MNVKTGEQNNQKENFKIHMGKKGKKKEKKGNKYYKQSWRSKE